MTNSTKKAAPRKKPVEVVSRIPGWVIWVIVGSFCISLATSTVAFVTVLNSRGEHDRSCAVSARSIHLALDGIYNLPQRTAIPKRTPAEEKARQASIAQTNEKIDAQLAKC